MVQANTAYQRSTSIYRWVDQEHCGKESLFSFFFNKRQRICWLFKILQFLILYIIIYYYIDLPKSDSLYSQDWEKIIKKRTLRKSNIIQRFAFCNNQQYQMIYRYNRCIVGNFHLKSLKYVPIGSIKRKIYLLICYSDTNWIGYRQKILAIIDTINVDYYVDILPAICYYIVNIFDISQDNVFHPN